MVTVHVSGDFKKTENLLEKIASFGDDKYVLKKYGKKGVDALESATPVDSGKTASSWSYSISEGDGSISVDWENSNVNKGLNIAVLLQYGHGTRNGGYVEGRDYINPAMQPIFDKFADAAWKEITK